MRSGQQRQAPCLFRDARVWPVQWRKTATFSSERRTKMKKLLLISTIAFAIGAPAAKASQWWILNSQDGTCDPAAQAVDMTRDPAFASPFTLAAEMRTKGRLNAPTDQKRLSSSSGYAVHYDGVVTAYF